MRLEKSRWLAYALGTALLAACGGGDDNGGTSKTFSSPEDGAQLAAIMASLSTKIGQNPQSSGKALGGKSVRAKDSFDCPNGGTLDFTDDPSTPLFGDGTYVFTNCTLVDPQTSTTTSEDGQLVFTCTDPNQDEANCFADRFTFGTTSNDLVVHITDPTTDLLGQFFNFVLTLADNRDGTDDLTLDGHVIITANTACGSGDFTVDTTDPLVLDTNTQTITAGSLTLTAADGSSASATYSANGVTVTVNGVSDVFTTAELAECSG